MRCLIICRVRFVARCPRPARRRGRGNWSLRSCPGAGSGTGTRAGALSVLIRFARRCLLVLGLVRLVGVPVVRHGFLESVGWGRNGPSAPRETRSKPPPAPRAGSPGVEQPSCMRQSPRARRPPPALWRCRRAQAEERRQSTQGRVRVQVRCSGARAARKRLPGTDVLPWRHTGRTCSSLLCGRHPMYRSSRFVQYESHRGDDRPSTMKV